MTGSPWRTTEQAARFLAIVDNATGEPRVKDCWAFLKKAGIPHRYLGSELRFHIDDLQALLTTRRGEVVKVWPSGIDMGPARRRRIAGES